MIIAMVFIAPITMLILAALFIFRYAKYKYVGNVLLYIGGAFLLCFLMMLAVNLNAIDVKSYNGVEQAVAQSSNPQSSYSVYNSYTQIVTNKNVSFSDGGAIFFDAVTGAVRMMTLTFDRDAIGAFFTGENITGWHQTFGVMFYITSLFSLATTSISVILFFFKNNFAKASNFFKLLLPKTELYYIFSDAKVANATKRLGHALKSKKHAVVMYVTKASLKTQEGTEYRDMLINEGFDVRSEGFSKNLCAYLFKKFFNRNYQKRWFLWRWYRNRKVTIYGLFDNDDASITLASNFTAGILENKCLQKEFKDYFSLRNESNEGARDYTKISDAKKEKDLEVINNFKVFITYQDHDIDIVNNFSGQTFHIVNTLSQYDMVSSEFILSNPLCALVNGKQKESDGLNVSFFGFGNINRPIFKKMTFAYQNSEDNTHKMHYFIYDLNSNKIVDQLKNEYTDNVTTEEDYFDKPLLYTVDAKCDGVDLTAYESLKKHFEELLESRNKAENERDKNRFVKDGLELFIVSAATTNQDIRIAFNLREILIKTFKEDELKNARIYVRIGDELIAKGLMDANKFVFDQKSSLSIEHMDKNNKPLIPIIIFGEDTNMAHFIDTDYKRLVDNGKAAYGAYWEGQISEWTPVRENLSWLFVDKKEVLANTSTAYSLKSKLNILDYKLNRKGLIVDKNNIPVDSKVVETIFEVAKEDYPELDTDEHPFNQKVRLLAYMEHNRWLATEYGINRYGQLKKSDFNQKSMKTKNPTKTNHVCMTTNEGLGKIYDIFKNDDERKEKAKKLVFSNDIDTVSKVLKQLSDNNRVRLLFFDINDYVVKSVPAEDEKKNFTEIEINDTIIAYINNVNLDSLAKITRELDAELIEINRWGTGKKDENEVNKYFEIALASHGIELCHTLNNGETKEDYVKTYGEEHIDSYSIIRISASKIDIEDFDNKTIKMHRKKGLTNWRYGRTIKAIKKFDKRKACYDAKKQKEEKKNKKKQED